MVHAVCWLAVAAALGPTGARGGPPPGDWSVAYRTASKRAWQATQALRYPAAEAAYAEASEAARGEHRRSGSAAALAALAEAEVRRSSCQLFLGRPAQAQTALEGVDALLRRPDTVIVGLAARVKVQLARIASHGNTPAAAERHLDAADQLVQRYDAAVLECLRAVGGGSVLPVERVGNPVMVPDRWEVLNVRAEVLFTEGRVVEAAVPAARLVEHCEAAFAATRGAWDGAALADALIVSGKADSALGRLPAAARSFQRAAVLYGMGATQTGLSRHPALINGGVVAARRGDLAGAERLFREADAELARMPASVARDVR